MFKGKVIKILYINIETTYDDKIIMAAGTFTEGSTIELSCDGPIRPPYIAFIQGGLTFEYGKIGVLKAIQEMLEN